jgi:hypothetical protein
MLNWGAKRLDIIHINYTLGHKLGTTKFEIENISYIALFSC